MPKATFSVIFAILLMVTMVFPACQKSSEKLLLPAPREYRSWNTTTDTTLNYPIPGHLDNCRIIYINSIGETVSIGEENGRQRHEYPEGTIIVKEIYKGLEEPEEGEEPISLTIMMKAPQHSDAQNGWLWISKTSHPEKEQIIEHEFCMDCHTNANEPHPYGDKNPNNEYRDFVYFPPPRK